VDFALNIGLVLVGGMTLALFGVSLLTEDSQGYDGLQVGARPKSQLILDPSDQPQALADFGAGKCRYVVFYWSECSHCGTLAFQWRQDIAIEGPDILPRDWTVVWVSRLANPVTEFPLPSEPVFTGRPVSDDAFSKEFGITAFPYYAVVDRNGRLLERGVGGRLPEKHRFNTDCSVEEDGS
jgi:hypothetical protein